jgi:hypothetical protein
MAAILILSLIMLAIHATWMSIVKGTRLGLSAAASVQRSRIAMRTLQDAFLTVQMYAENLRYYFFVADASGDYSAISMVSRLPFNFPGVGRYGDQIVRRVEFFTQPGTNGTAELVMTQVPILLATNETSIKPYSLVLARDVSIFMLEYWDEKKREWATEWFNTNALPRLVRITLGQGKVAGAISQPQDIVSRIVALPASISAGMQSIQNMPGVPGAPPPGAPMAPGQYPGGYPPGQSPGQYPGGYRPGQYPGGANPSTPIYPGGGGIRR